MTRYLVAADADQIQNFLFRSSHLREVIGGSRMLARFCDQTKEKHQANEEVIISGGGNFCLDFDNPQKAKNFLEELAEDFREKSGTTLTVAGPEEYEETGNGFQGANRHLQRKLMEAKLRNPNREASFHLPITAFCASCGVSLAVTHASPAPEVGATRSRAIYLCEHCRSKAQFRKDELNSFYDKYRTALRDVRKLHSWTFPSDPAEELGALDPTHYVAYIIADGNGMGKLFDQQPGKEELKSLSEQLETAMWSSLAAPVPHLIDRLEELEKYKGWCPVVPLIVAGDDLFALTLARYSLDTARYIGKVFEEQMNGKATLGIAVVICQSHYPYMLAHEHGEKMLKQAKKVGKALGKVSTIIFDVIVGNELAQFKQDQNPYRPTLKPYLCGMNESSHQEAGISIKTLLEAKLKVYELPGKRKSELRALFNPKQVEVLDKDDERKIWEQKLNKLRERLDPKVSSALKQVLSALGDENAKPGAQIWRSVKRPNELNRYLAHGLPDLIEAWDYAYRLDIPDMVYQMEGK